MRCYTQICLTATLFALGTADSKAQSPAFSSSEQLKENGVPFTGQADLACSLGDAPTDGGQVGTTLQFPGVQVVSGLFAVVPKRRCQDRKLRPADEPGLSRCGTRRVRTRNA
jgi:hypothetical protein